VRIDEHGRPHPEGHDPVTRAGTAHLSWCPPCRGGIVISHWPPPITREEYLPHIPGKYTILKEDGAWLCLHPHGGGSNHGTFEEARAAVYLATADDYAEWWGKQGYRL
jgi:hypothetical protein